MVCPKLKKIKSFMKEKREEFNKIRLSYFNNPFELRYQDTDHTYSKHYNPNQFNEILYPDPRTNDDNKKLHSRSFLGVEFPEYKIKDIEAYYKNLIACTFYNAGRIFDIWYDMSPTDKSKFRMKFIKMLYNKNDYDFMIPNIRGDQIKIPIDWHYSRAIMKKTKQYCNYIFYNYKTKASYFGSDFNYCMSNACVQHIVELSKIIKNKKLIQNTDDQKN